MLISTESQSVKNKYLSLAMCSFNYTVAVTELNKWNGLIIKELSGISIFTLIKKKSLTDTSTHFPATCIPSVWSPEKDDPGQMLLYKHLAVSQEIRPSTRPWEGAFIYELSCSDVSEPAAEFHSSFNWSHLIHILIIHLRTRDYIKRLQSNQCINVRRNKL